MAVIKMVEQGPWSAEGTETGTPFEDIDFEEGDWADYDEKVHSFMMRI